MTNQSISTADQTGQSQRKPGTLTLEQVAPVVGEPMQLQIGSKCHFATLVGFLKGQSLIVTIPEEPGPAMQLDEGVPLLVRFSVDKRTYAFDTSVYRVTDEPFPCLYLSYPESVQALKERRHERIEVNIAGAADTQTGASYSCVVRDISIGGALIALHNQTGIINDPLLLTLRVSIDGIEYELALNSEIRSVRVGDSASGEPPPVLQGLAFNDLSEQEVLALAAFDLLPDWNSPA